MQSAGRVRSFLFALVLAFPAVGQVARVEVNRHLVEWTPVIEAEEFTLSLSDPRGRVRTYPFGPGKLPTLSLFDLKGKPLPDGTYTWELRATPPLGTNLERDAESDRRPAYPPVQSGYFSLIDGSLVNPDQAETPDERHSGANTSVGPTDQIVPDDLIVDGKGCIGLGCSNIEAFGPEAMRLKQSVVRLRFEDTSNPATFPARDWQLVANDAASGGADRFSLEDLTAGTTPMTFRGGAPNNSLFVDGVGNVGLGTATPETRLHLRSTDPTTASFGPSKFLVENANSTNTPRELFELRNNGSVAFIFKDQSVPERWSFQGFANSFIIDNQNHGGIEYNFGPTGNLVLAGNLTAGNFPSSSRTLKENFDEIDPVAVLNRLISMPISEWSFLADPEHKRHIGPTVEDFQATFGLGTHGQSLVITDVGGVALASLQGLHSLVEEQRQTIERQQALIDQLEKRMQRLEAQNPSEPKPGFQP